MWIAFFYYHYWTLQGLKLSGATLHINKFLPISSLQVQVAFYQTRNDFLLTFLHYLFYSESFQNEWTQICRSITGH